MVRRLFLLRQEAAPPPHPTSPSPDASLQNAERDSAFELAINALPRRQREVAQEVWAEWAEKSEMAKRIYDSHVAYMKEQGLL